MMHVLLFLSFFTVSLWSAVAFGESAAEVYFITPRSGDTLSTPFVVRFGLRNMGVAPAGVAVPNTGHHHLLIDVDKPDLDKPILSDEQHRHFGGGQTETELSLPPGKHTLQLLLGDHTHRPHQPPLLSEKIIVHIE